MSDQETPDRARGLDGEQDAAVAASGLVKEFEAGIATQVLRVSGLFGAVLGKIGLRLEVRDPLDHSERKRVILSLFHEGARARPFFFRYASLMALSVTIASLGILADSTAVVIGAMLVAPLMGPVLGVAAAIVMAWPRRVVRQSFLVWTGAGLAIGLAALLSLLVPGNAYPLPSELLARTSPNLLDMGIALAAGAVGAYGRVRRNASDALPGVAIAVALVPPLAVCGIAVQLAEWQMALGALLLFCVNVIGIVMSAGLTFIASGFVPGMRLLSGNTTIASGLRWSALAAIVVLLALQFGRGRILPLTDQTVQAAAAVEEFVGASHTGANVIDVSMSFVDGVADIHVVLSTAWSAPPMTDLAAHLAEALDSPVRLRLQVVEAARTGTVTLSP